MNFGDEMTIEDLIARVRFRTPQAEVNKIRDRHPEYHAQKFFDSVTFGAQACHQAQRVGLFDAKPGRLLDIGCAFGYLLVAAEELGHWAGGIDTTSMCIFDACELFNVRYFPQNVKAFEPLTIDHQGYDFITVFGVNFAEGGRFWGFEEYDFFFRDCVSRLNPGGIVWVEYNRGEQTSWLADAKWPGMNFEAVDNRIRIKK